MFLFHKTDLAFHIPAMYILLFVEFKDLTSLFTLFAGLIAIERPSFSTVSIHNVL